ncbi:uncharacterized protein BDZ99DRAFT_499957 [Mytilinidion resinicola]|uniref:Mid2 domain-containing protein n=1 Tax=Mytilinidion resinicola TaxID=574789 RepID=A0A6A6YG89_9PEZI|nr:uncharacterized protein BDZ99DRAFT_499957 [Mytilinidion resinicola]KAF2807609.1 hypothetical protein BDZ99DRAFT_499957 [Mytilinidion resinicola]
MSIPAEANSGGVTSWIPVASVFTPSSGSSDMPTSVDDCCIIQGRRVHDTDHVLPLVTPWTMPATTGPVNGDCISGVSKGIVLTYASTALADTTDWQIVTTTLTASTHVGAIAVAGYNAARASVTSASSPFGSSTSSRSASRSPTSSTASPSPASSTVSHSLASSTASPSPALSNGVNPPISSPTQATTQATTPDDGMSTGIKVGIGLGVALGAIGIAALVIATIMLRRRSEKKSNDSNAAASVYESGNKPVSTFHDAPQQYAQHDNPIYELHSHSIAQELASKEARSPVEIGNHGS